MDHPTPDSVVVIGAGQAALATAEALRAGAYAGPITLLGDEHGGPYHRPPLSKAWLAGEMDVAQLTMRAPEMLERKRIALRPGVRVQALDRTARQVRLQDGTTLAYGGLVLATGSRARTLDIPGAQAPNVQTLRNRADADRLAQGLAHCAATGQPLVVVGGGFIGLEVAATARKKGVPVVVLEAAPLLLGRVLAPVLSDWYARLHRSQGVELVFNARLAALETDRSDRACAVLLADGTRIPAGWVLVGVGAVANDELAREAGLACDRGIVVDACSRTSDPCVVAAGDCTARQQPDGALLRLESVQNATEQGKSAAAALLGQERPFTATPWFWSDQYDRKLQMAGLSQGADRWAVVGDMEGPSFSVQHFRAGHLVAVDSVNDPRGHLQARKELDQSSSSRSAG